MSVSQNDRHTGAVALMGDTTSVPVRLQTVTFRRRYQRNAENLAFDFLGCISDCYREIDRDTHPSMVRLH